MEEFFNGREFFDWSEMMWGIELLVVRVFEIPFVTWCYVEDVISPCLF